MSINCCNGCVPPKRHTACWGSCPEYAQQKAKHEMEKAEINKRKAIQDDIYRQRINNIDKALKKRRKKG